MHFTGVSVDLQDLEHHRGRLQYETIIPLLKSYISTPWLGNIYIYMHTNYIIHVDEILQSRCKEMKSSDLNNYQYQYTNYQYTVSSISF